MLLCRFVAMFELYRLLSAGFLVVNICFLGDVLSGPGGGFKAEARTSLPKVADGSCDLFCSSLAD